MKTATTTTESTEATAILKAIELELVTILENDIRNLHDERVRKAAFLQLIAA
jgi:hypothetical protein